MITKEQLEEIGWIYRPDTIKVERGIEIHDYWLVKGKFSIIINKNFNRVTIVDESRIGMLPNIIFNWDIEDIEDLKVIFEKMKI